MAEVGGPIVVTLVGEIDMANATDIELDIERRSGRGTDIVIDLARVSFIDSAGIAVLNRLAARQLGGGSTLVIVAPPGGFARRVLEIVDLGLPLRDSLNPNE